MATAPAPCNTPGGGQQRVRGSATEGDAVFVRAGLIEGTAPELEVVTVEV